MTENAWGILGQYMRDRADELGLRDWHLFLTHIPPDDEDADGICTPTEGRKHATIKVCRDFKEQLKPDAQRAVIIHELLHCHFQAAVDMVRVDLPRLLGQPAYDVFFPAFRRSMEYAVDGITDAIADKFPLIEWTEGED